MFSFFRKSFVTLPSLLTKTTNNLNIKQLLMSQINGHISQIIGPVIDVFFDTEGQDAEKVLPKIHEALSIERPNGTQLIVEVQQHIGEDTVRCVAMDNTDGLQRGLEAKPLGSPIQMPAGEQIKGRMLNVIGQPIDGMKQLDM